MTEAALTLNLTNDADVTALSDELRALGADDSEITRGASSPQTWVTGVTPEMLARALDHLRNADKSSEDLLRERDLQLMRLRIPPRTYLLRSWQFTADEQDKAFWSYTGPYAKDDRLVTFSGHEFRVFELLEEATNTKPGALLVVRK